VPDAERGDASIAVTAAETVGLGGPQSVARRRTAWGTTSCLASTPAAATSTPPLMMASASPSNLIPTPAPFQAPAQHPARVGRGGDRERLSVQPQAPDLSGASGSIKDHT
jgi:hypothetical protein